MRYAKAVVAALAAAAATAYAVLNDGVLSNQEIVLIIIAGLNVLGVWLTPNSPDDPAIGGFPLLPLKDQPSPHGRHERSTPPDAPAP